MTAIQLLTAEADALLASCGRRLTNRNQAEILGVAEQHLSRWKHGRVLPSVDSIQTMIRALHQAGRSVALTISAEGWRVEKHGRDGAHPSDPY